MAKNSLTPVRRQYLDIKRQYPDAILFFRLGDFYETFDEDAEIVARELDLVLTSRPVGKGLRAPLAGVPYHSAENYIARLIAKGYRVAICEQIGEQPSRGIFPRKVVRVVTPGTVFEPNMLPAGANNYLVAVVPDGERAAVAYTDITTGEFAVTELETPTEAPLRAELLRLHPAEVLHPQSWPLPAGVPGHDTPWTDWRFEPGRCQQVLRDHFQVATLDAFGIAHRPLAQQAAGAILQYLQETEPAALNLLTSLRTYSLQEFMTLDASARRNLELTETLRGETRGSLLWVLDKTVTPMGKRLLRQWVGQPLLDVAAIEQRQEGVQFFFADGLLRAEVRAALKPLADLERLINRIVAGHAQPRDLIALRATLRALPAIRALFADHETEALPVAQLDLCPAERDLLEKAIAEDPPATLQNTGVIREGFSDELDQVIQASAHARDWIANLESVERERTGIKNLKVGYNKVFGYYIEVTRANTDRVPSEYIRKQTLVNAERYITPEMKEYETLVLNAEEEIKKLETRLFRQVCQQLAASAGRLRGVSQVLAELDVLASLAETAAVNGYVRPQVSNLVTLDIRNGRHPVVEQTLTAERFIANDIVFEDGEIIRLITGPNMSGKSTYLRQTALIVLMAQMGSFVPAESAHIGLVDRIFTRIGAQDEIHAGQSTFMVEMIETANILHHATPRSLLILDEIGRGTSTYDGVAIAWAMVEYIHNHPKLRARTLFATHYHELTELADHLPGVRNYNVAVSEADGQVVFLHKIVPGGADKSYGIHVARLAGLPSPVVQRASEIMAELERTSGRARRRAPAQAQQMALFPETNPLLDALRALDINNLSPVEALNKLYEWQQQFADD